MERRLAAILVADVVGYSRLMEVDETGTRERLHVLRAELIDPKIAEYHGRLVKEMGDGLLVEFASAVEAVQYAADVQRAMARRNVDVPHDMRIELRIGINVGDVIVEGDDLHGSGVNIAARLEGLAVPGGIAVSQTVFDHVKGKVRLGLEAAGEHRVKNIAEPLALYRVSFDDTVASRRPIAAIRSRRSLLWIMAAVLAVVGVAGVFFYPSDWRSNPSGGDVWRAPSLPTGPSIAVLPFENLGGDPEQAYFADGLTEDLIAALGRYSSLSVLARSATSPFKEKPAAPQEIGRILGVRYLLAGSVRKAENRIRVSTQLIDATSGLHLWSDRYERELSDIFEVQDEITRNVAGALAVELRRVESVRAATKPTESLDAYDYVLRGLDLTRRLDRASNITARDLFRRAIELDPDYAAAYSGLATAYRYAVNMGWSEFIAADLDRTDALALKALELDPNSAEARRVLAAVHLRRGEHALAAAQLERALEINPSDAASFQEYGRAMMYIGDEKKAIEWFEAARKLDPNWEPGRLAELALAYYLAGRYADAIDPSAEALERQHDYFISHIVQAAAYAQLEMKAETSRAVEEVLRVRPFFTISWFVSQFRDAEDAAHLAEGLGKAGLPDTFRSN